MYARLRAAPRWLEKMMCDAMDTVIDRRGPSFAARPPGGGITTRDCVSHARQRLHAPHRVRGDHHVRFERVESIGQSFGNLKSLRMV